MGYSRPSIVERRYIASADLIHSHDAVKDTNGLWWELAKTVQFRVPMVASTIRFKCKFKHKNAGTERACMAFYKNGTLKAGGLGVWTNDTDFYIEKSADIAGWNKDDKFSVYLYCPGPTYDTQCKELRLYGKESYFENTV
jgi:hypothetical protein